MTGSRSELPEPALKQPNDQRWRRGAALVDRQGSVVIDLHRADGASVSVVVSRNADGPSIARVPGARVSYSRYAGVSSGEAALVAKRFAQSLATNEGKIEELFAAAQPVAGPPPTTDTSGVASPTSPRTAVPARVPLSAHTFALRASGFTLLPDFVSREEIPELGAAADRALAATRRKLDEGAKVPAVVFDRDFYFGARSIYLWGDAPLRLLENETMRELTQAVIGPHKLLEMLLFDSAPAPEVDWLETEGWHRDVEPVPGATRYLWFMLPLDGYRADNGSTWVVPGSHHLPAEEITAPSEGPHRFMSRVQILLQAGDALVLDPTVLHSRGHNTTKLPRRMLNVMLCHETTPIQNNDHWTHAGRKLRESASPRVREMLGASPSPEARAALASGTMTAIERVYGGRTPAWPALPDDWEP